MDHIKGEADFERSKASAKVIVYDFTATWCGPCKMLAPILEDLSKLYPEQEARFYKVDVDENREIAMKFNISAVPSVAFCKDGKIERELLIGVRPAADYKNKVDALLK